MEKPFDDIWWDPQPENVAVDVARNRQVHKFLRMGYDSLLFADIDATWAVDAITRLISRDLPIVSGVIFRRAVPPVPVYGPYMGKDKTGHIYSFGEGIRRLFSYLELQGVTEPPANNAICFPETDQDLYEVGGHGMHFCLIKREVLEKIPPPWFRMTELGAGEDFYFCRQVLKHGYKLHVDMSVMTGHELGPGVSVGIKEFMMYHHKSADGPEENDRWEMGGWA